MRRIERYIAILILIVFIFSIGDSVCAIENKKTNEKISEESTEMEYSDEFVEWLNLPDKEKENVMMPRMYEIPNYNKPEPLFYSLNEGLTEEKFCLTEYLDIVAKDQGSTGSCWAFSGIGSLESTLALQDYYKYGSKDKVGDYDFSERHLVYSTTRDFTDGKNLYGLNKSVSSGNPSFVVNYLTNGMGAILEEDMPFVESEEQISLSEIQGKKVVTKVTDTVDFPSCDPTTDDTTEVKAQIKSHIKQYGGVMAAIYGAQRTSEYYDAEHGAIYCDNKNKTINHQVLIIGWDDTYAETNFSSLHRPSSPGAWIIKNSWGTDIGNNGLMYISYEDVNVYSFLIGIENATMDVDYDNIYQYNELGYSSYRTHLGINKVYIATAFDKKTAKTEYITEVGLNCPEIYNCKVYVNTSGTSKLSRDLAPIELDDGSYSKTCGIGYHTLKFAEPLEILADNFVIVIEIEGCSILDVEGELRDDCVMYSLEKKITKTNYFDYAKIEQNKCFVANETNFGKGVWEDLSTNAQGDLTIKAFTIEKTDLECSITSFGNDEDELTNIKFFKEGEDTPSYQCNVAGYGKKDFTVKDVEYGKYTVKIEKKNHATREYELIVDVITNTDFKIHLLGDINGDGYVSLIDWDCIYKHLREAKEEDILTGYKLLCGDINKDGYVGLIDWDIVYKYLRTDEPIWKD